MKEESLQSIREILEDKEIIDYEIIEQLRIQRQKTSLNNLLLAKLFVICYDLLYNNLKSFEKEKENMKKYLDNLNIEKIRSLLLSYEDGNRLGDNYFKLRIEREVTNNRREYSDLITMFFNIFGGEG